LIISPAKTLDYETKIPYQAQSELDFLKESTRLVRILKKLKPEELAELMHVSSKIAYLNHDRYAQWDTPINEKEARQALFAFKGEVYNGLKAYDLEAKDIEYAQSHMRILSGLYGLLKPLDLMLPYRLEMGTKLSSAKFKNLYEFWGDKISKKLQQDIKESGTNVLVNLASKEYFKSVNTKKIKARIVTPIFKEAKEDHYKVIAIFAKKARGLMSRYIIQNKIEDPEELKHFDLEGYFYNETLSSENEFIFTRG